MPSIRNTLAAGRGLVAAAALAALGMAALGACGADEELPPPPTPTTASALIDHAEFSRLELGQPAPDFSLLSSDGETVALADYRGEPVLLYFHMADG